MYKFVTLTSILIRMLLIPNPFKVLGEGKIVNIGEMSILLPPELLNIIAEPIMHIVTFSVVGLFYARGNNPIWGSGLYLFVYGVHILLIWLMAKFGFSIAICVAVIFAYMYVLNKILENYRMN